MPQITPLALSTPKARAPGWAYVLESALPPDPSKTPLISLHSNAAQGKKRKDGTLTGGRAAARTATEALLGGHAKQRAARQRQRLEDLGVEIGHRGYGRSVAAGAGGDGVGGGSGGMSGHHGHGGGMAGGGGAHASTGGIELPAQVRKEVVDARWKITKGGGKSVGGGPAGQAKLTQNVRRVLGSTKAWGHHAADAEALAQLQMQQVQNQSARSKMAQQAKQKGGDVVMRDAMPWQGPEADDEEEDLSTLLHTDVPLFPSEDVLERLVKTLPLSYSSARASSTSQPGPPPRKFCAMCGYWGKVKCTVCGAQVCGLSCKLVHDSAEHPHMSR
jgi:hypothetical protein